MLNEAPFLPYRSTEKIYEKKGTTLNPGVQFPDISGSSQSTKQTAFTENVSQSDGDVKYSFKETDNQGRPVSKEQQNYFVERGTISALSFNCKLLTQETNCGLLHGI